VKQDGPSSLIAGGALDSLDVGVVVLDTAGRVVLWNAWMQRASGISLAAALGAPLTTLFPRLAQTRLPGAIEDALRANIPSVFSHALNRTLLDLTTADGRPMLQNVVVRPLLLDGAAHAAIQVSDMTATARREHFLRSRREARYRAVVETATDAIVTTDVKGSIQWINSAAEAIFGRRSADLVGAPIGAILADAEKWPRGRSAETPSPVEIQGRRADGSLVPLEMAVATWESDEARSFTTGILRDISERKRTQSELESALDAKTMLLREINHRVKNSLNLVSSLLTLQAGQTAEPAMRLHFDDARNRIHAIAQVHERLYQSDKFEAVEISSYLDQLCADVVRGAGGPSVVQLTVSSDRVEVPIDQAVPLGLMASELITNAIKHGRSTGMARVEVSFRSDGDDFEMRVADHGPGLPADFDPTRARGLGIRLVLAFAQQIGAAIDFPETEVGAIFRIRGRIKAS